AEDWELVDDVTLQFSLRQNVVFHDGTPFNADDVVFSFERIVDPATGATQKAAIESTIASVDKVDDYTVRIVLREPTASVLELLARPEVAMVSKEFVESGGDYKTQVMGTGPFSIGQIEPEVRYVLERHESYHKDGLPYLDALHLIPIVD